MLFGSYIVFIATGVYIVGAIGYAWQGHWTWSLIYSAYAMANIGLVMASEGWK